MSVTAGLREVPALEANRELVLPSSKERTLANGLTVIAIERRSVPLVEITAARPIRTEHAGPRFRRAGSPAESDSVLRHRHHVHRRYRGRSAGRRWSTVSRGRLRPVARVRQRPCRWAGSDVRDPRRRARPAPRTRSQKSRPNGPGWPIVSRWPSRSPSHLVRVALLKRMYGTHPYALETPSIADVVDLSRTKCVAMHAARVHPAGATLVVVGDIDAVATLDLAEAALSAVGTAPARARSSPPTPPLRAGPLVLANRPGSVQSSLRAGPAGGAATPPRPCRAAAGEPDLRRLLLVALGREHPRGQGLHVRPALGGRALGGRLGRDPLRRGGDGGHRGGAAGDLVRAGPAGHGAATVEELEQARQYALGLAAARACRPRPAWPAWPAPTPGTGCGWTSWPSTRAGWRPRPSSEVAAAGAAVPGPAKAVTVVLGDADVVAPSLATLAAVERTATRPAVGAERRRTRVTPRRSLG